MRVKMTAITRDHVKTACMLIIHLSMGLTAAVVGPSMMDMAELTGANIEQLSRAVMFKSIGFVVGSLLGGFLADRFRTKADGIISLVAFIHGLSCIMIPMVPNLIFMGFCFVLQGLGNSILNVVLMSFIMVMWDEKAGLPIHALHMAWSIGSAICPLYTGPFLSQPAAPPDDLLPKNWINSSNGFQSFFNTSIISHGQESRIAIPFGISGGVTLLGSAIFLWFFIFAPGHNSPRMRESKSLKNMLAAFNYREKEGCFAILMMASIFCLYVILVGRDLSLALFLAPIAVQSRLHMSKPTAAILATAYTAIGAVGRALRSILSHHFKIHIILFTDVILSVCFCILLAIYGLHSALALWILSCTAGFFGFPNYPSLLVWLNCYIETSGFIVTMVDVGIGCGWFISTWVDGYLFEYYGPEHVLYLVAASACIMLVILVPLQVLAILHGERHDKDSDVTITIDETAPLVNTD